MNELWIPIFTLFCFTTIAIVMIFIGSKNKNQVHVTIRQLLEKGENITPELLEKLGSFKSQKVQDLRRGLALASIGLACIFAGFIIEEIRTGFAIGIFPLFLGIAFFISWKLSRYAD